MARNFLSGLVGGVAAAVIWIGAALWAGIGTAEVGMWAIIILVATTLVASLIAGAIGSRARSHAEVPPRA